MARVVLVTGGTQGIGESIAHYLAAQNWTVVISGRNVKNGQKVVEAIKDSHPNAPPVTFIAADIGIQSEIAHLHAEILRLHGRLDAAINNAGITADFGKFADLSTKGMEDLFQVNVHGLFWSMQEQIKIMLKQDVEEEGEGKTKKGGSIVNISSAAGLHGLPGNGAYSGAKHAVIGFTRSAALDYAKDAIRISAIAPAGILTPMVTNAYRDGTFTPEIMDGMHPVGHIGAPEDVSKAVGFLLDSPFVTGTVIEVDGGYGAA